MIPAQSLHVVGVDCPNKGKGPGRRFEIALCAPGDPLELRPEPDNPAEEHAIAVYSERGVQIGYVSSQRAVRVAQLIKQGCTIIAIFQEVTPYGAVARMSFDGEGQHPPRTPRLIRLMSSTRHRSGPMREKNGRCEKYARKGHIIPIDICPNRAH